MFDIGMFEMFVVVVLAIIVVGPRDLPKMLRTLGQIVRKVRSMGQEFQTGIRQIADEIELEEVTRKLNQAGNIPLEQAERKPDIVEDGEEEVEPKAAAAASADTDATGKTEAASADDKARGAQS